MSQTVIIDGTTFTIPSVNDYSWGQNVTDLLIKLANNSSKYIDGNHVLTSMEVFSDGSGQFGLDSNFLQFSGVNVALGGAIRLANPSEDLVQPNFFTKISWRDDSNTGDISLFPSSNDILSFAGKDLVNLDSEQTLQNKTMEDVVLTATDPLNPTTPLGVTGSAIITDNTLSTASDYTLVSSLSVKTYIDVLDAAQQVILDDHETRLVSQQGQITSNDADIADHEARITVNESNRVTDRSDIDSNQAQIISNDVDILAAEGRLTINEANRIADRADIDSNDVDIATLQSDKADKTTSVIAGVGLDGGGDLSTDRTVEFALTVQPEKLIPTAADKLMIYDVTSSSYKKIDIGNLPIGAGGSPNWSNMVVDLATLMLTTTDDDGSIRQVEDTKNLYRWNGSAWEIYFDFVNAIYQSDLDTHTTNITNPHSVTATQLGLGNVDDTSDSDKPISTLTQAALDTKVVKTGSDTTDKIMVSVTGSSTEIKETPVSVSPTGNVSGVQTIQILQDSIVDGDITSNNTEVTVAKPLEVTGKVSTTGGVKTSSVDTEDATDLVLGNVGNTTIIAGNFQVDGSTTTVGSATLEVNDANIVVNKGGNAASAQSQGAGITVEMSDTTDATVSYSSSSATKFKIGESGSEADIVDVSSSQVLSNKHISRSDNSVIRSISSKNANYSMTTSDDVIFASGDITIDLPNTTLTGQEVVIKKTDAVGTTVTVNALSSVDGQPSTQLTQQNESLTFINDGFDWFII